MLDLTYSHTMTPSHDVASKQTDYLALQVERLADAVEALSERLRLVEQRNAGNDAVSKYRNKQSDRSWKYKELAWRAFWGLLLAAAAYLIRLAAPHVTIK